MNTVVSIAVAEIERDKDNPRKEFDETELWGLGRNMMAHGQLVPVILHLSEAAKILLDGERRLRAALLVGMTHLNAVVLPSKPSETTLRLLQMSLEVHKASWTPMERSNQLFKIKQENGWSVGELADKLYMKQSVVSRSLANLRLAPELQELLQSGRLNGEHAYQLSQEPDHDKQRALAQETVGLSRDQVRLKLRKKGGGEQPKVRRAVFVLSSGMSITVQGKEITLDDTIESLSQTVRELKRAQAQGLNAETAQRVFRDRAKAKT